MDSLSQIVLGGAVGEAVLGRKVGNKAILWGAIGGTIPDLDTLPGQFMETVDRLAIHRGFSHSIIFAILIAPLLGWLVHRLYKKKEASVWDWTMLFFWSIFTHPLLDIFTTWGTQLFWPLDWRIAIQSIFVIDPLYTLPFLICLLIVLFLKRDSQKRRMINRLGLSISSLYLIYTVGVKLYVDSLLSTHLESKKTDYISFESRPTPLNTILWTFNIDRGDYFEIAYYSLFDSEVEKDFLRFDKNHDLLNRYRNNPKIERLVFLTKGKYVMENRNGALLMHDLRFGLINGIEETSSKDFVFSYEIKESNGELEITQVQQKIEDTQLVLNKLWTRMMGIKSV